MSGNPDLRALHAKMKAAARAIRAEMDARLSATVAMSEAAKAAHTFSKAPVKDAAYTAQPAQPRKARFSPELLSQTARERRCSVADAFDWLSMNDAMADGRLPRHFSET